MTICTRTCKASYEYLYGMNRCPSRSRLYKR